MLNIPDEVKALFKADSVFKNFHVHFPNGENADLNNDDVVSESVEFTESICSQQSFRFGLTEASELKFTAVNIPNVRGATLEAALEIDIETLGSEWAEQHAPSGTESFLDPQVCTYGSRNMYRVPYGRFIVDTCPRNHEAMWKREVTAYTKRMDEAQSLNPGQIAVMNAQYADVQTYTPYVKALSIATLYNGASSLDGTGYTQGELTTAQVQSPTSLKVITLTLNGGTTKKIYAEDIAAWYQVTNPTDRDIFRIDWGDYYAVDYVEAVAEVLANRLDINLQASGYASHYELASDLLSSHQESVRFYVKAGTWGGFVTVPQGTELIYPHIAQGDVIYPIRPNSVYIRDYDDYSIVGFVGMNRATFSVYHDASTDLMSTLTLSFDSTLQTKKGKNNLVYNTYSFANAFSLSGIVQGYLELQCRFGSPARAGGMEVTALDNTTSTAVLPSDYASLWYDETTISPIGYVALKFKDETGEEQDLTVQIGTGASVYDLSDNEVLKNMAFTVSKSEAEAGTTIESKLLAFLNSAFTPNIPDLSFVPIELEKKGLPYFEAGDAVTITTGDGQTVPSFILRQTIKGIQFLTASVESANGEAVEMVES